MQVQPVGVQEAFASGACRLRSARERPSAEEAARCIKAEGVLYFPELARLRCGRLL